MKALGIITILIGMMTLVLTVVGAALAADDIAWSLFLVGLLAIIVGQNCIVIARLQRRLQITQDKLAKVGSVVRSQESVLANQTTREELQQQGLLGPMGTAVKEDLDAPDSRD